EPSLAGIKADEQWNGLTRLGAAHGLLGDWAAAAAVLERAAARPDASALAGPLLAVAPPHPARRHRARGDCRPRPRRVGGARGGAGGDGGGGDGEGGEGRGG